MLQQAPAAILAPSEFTALGEVAAAVLGQPPLEVLDVNALRIACLLAFAGPVLAADPPGPAAKPVVKRVYSLRTPSGWMLDIHDDGSGRLGFGASLGNMVPAGTFKLDDVRKALDGAKLDPKGSMSSHFSMHYEQERKAPDKGPPARYTQDEKVVVPLFERAAAARREKTSGSLLESLGEKRPGFGLKK